MLRVNHLSGFGRRVPAAGGGGGAYAAVTWTSLVNVTESPAGTLTKTSGGTAYNAGAFSVESFAANGAIRWTADASSTIRMIGVSVTNTDNDYATIDYGWYQSGGNIYEVEDGGFNGPGTTITNGDVFEIVRTGTSIAYKKNGATTYTSAVSSSGTLKADCSIRSEGIAFIDVELKDG